MNERNENEANVQPYFNEGLVVAALCVLSGGLGFLAISIVVILKILT